MTCAYVTLHTYTHTFVQHSPPLCLHNGANFQL